MKKIQMFRGFVPALLISMIISANLSAQGPDHKMCCAKDNIPNITEDQTTKIETLKTAHMKEMTIYMAEMQTLEAELRQLEIADNADLNKINAKIDEISLVKAKMDKEHSKLKQSIRSILTSEQRTYFDANCCQGPGNGGCMKHAGNNYYEHQEQHGKGQGCTGK